MRSTFLPFSPPSIGPEEIDEVVDTLRSDWLTTGPKVGRFEGEFAEYVGAEAGVGLSSATAALHIALAVAGVGPGDAVIGTTMTFCSSIHVIEHVGARPVLVDVEPDTLNIDPAAIRAAIEREGGRVKAIMPVHLHGHPADLTPIRELAQAAGAAIIEDAAHALPARYKGQMIGARAETPEPPGLVAFSFYATKNLTTGEGGMLTGPAELIERARVWSLHGMSRDAFRRYTEHGSWRYDVVLAGFKYNMTDIAAALGLQQLRRLDVLQQRRNQIVAEYDRAFGGLDWLDLPVRRSEVEHAWHIYGIRLRLDRLDIDRSEFIAELRRKNIGSSVHFIPVHMHSYYRDKYGFRPGDLPVAEREFERMLSVPLSPRMSDQDVADVIDAVTEVGGQHRR